MEIKRGADVRSGRQFAKTARQNTSSGKCGIIRNDGTERLTGVKRADQVDVGRITGEFGIKGWLKVHSYTHPRENILTYSPWIICGNNQPLTVCVKDSQWHGKNLVIKIDGVVTREQAMSFRGSQIVILREQMAVTLADEYYLIDLIGLRVISVDGNIFGKVSNILETGTNEVLVVKGERERLIPLIKDTYVINIDLKAQTIFVDWDPDF